MSPSSPRLSVIIPARNAAATLGQQLDALLASDDDVEVLVCDNGSHDGTQDMVRAFARRDPRVQLVMATDALGAGHARNVGARRARSDLLGFCDADDVVGPGWVAAMIAALESGEFVTGPLELDRLNSPTVVSSRGRWLAGSEVKLFDGIFPFASGCNIGLRKSSFTTVGGFDETFVYGQDVELSLRCWINGITLGFAPSALVHYRYRADLDGMWSQGRNHGATRPHVYRRMRALSPQLPTRHVNWRSWLWLVRHIPDVRNPQLRGRWLWLAGSKAGHIRGSLAARVLCV